MAVQLHRCSNMWVKIGAHPCWRVQSALDEAGIPYEVVKHPAFPRSKRTDLEALTGQRLLPAIQFEDGSVLREQSADLAKRIRAGGLESPNAAASPSA